MKTIIPPLYERDIDFNDPFKNDVFGREDFAENLTSLFRKTNDGLVITINSKWGDGKTTFIKLWEQQLIANDDFIPIYFNAFQNDFQSDAFLSISASIHEAIKKKMQKQGISLKNKQQLTYLKRTTKKLAKDLFKMGMGVAVSSLTAGVVSNKSFIDWIVNFFKRLFIGVFDVNIDEQFESHIRSKKTINEYQEKLQSLLTFNTDRQKVIKKIVFFIDELDRCRPNFAVEIIEKVKHLFNMDNVFFVLAINKEQLLSTIASVYGVTPTESEIYLQKFVHLETKLPPMRGVDDSNAAEQVHNFLDELFSEFQLDERIVSIEVVKKVLSELSRQSLLDLNPRSLERVFTYLSISINSIDEDKAKELSKHFVVWSAFKVGRPDIYEEYRAGKIRAIRDERKYYDWLNKFYANEKEDQASNIFKIPLVSEVCRILDIYQIPKEELYFVDNASIKLNDIKYKK